MANVESTDLVKKQQIAADSEPRESVIERSAGAEPPPATTNLSSPPDPVTLTAVLTNLAKVSNNRVVIADKPNENEPPVTAENGNGRNDNLHNAGGRKRHRRKAKGGRHHRKWRPYTSLTWEQRRAVDERETRRACQKRERRFASGQPMAPYNTTQFLMDQHDTTESVFTAADQIRLRRRTRSGHGSGSESSPEEPYDSGDDMGVDSDNDEISGEESFLEREFSEAYENVHAERLQNMTKDDLVREYIELEARYEKLERIFRHASGLGGVAVKEDSFRSDSHGDNDTVLKRAHLLWLEDEIKRLKEENSRLVTENGGLRVTSTLVDGIVAPSV